ncbi:unnamed protein product, partial [Discosporangium mesarthrocarpum]
MALTARHRWCMAKLVEAFGEDVDASKSQAFMRKDENLTRFNSLFVGDGPRRLFVYHQ